MLRGTLLMALSSLALAGSAAGGQAPRAPIQLNPGASPPAGNVTTRTAVPSNWKIIDYGRDPLTRRYSAGSSANRIGPCSGRSSTASRQHREIPRQTAAAIKTQ